MKTNLLKTINNKINKKISQKTMGSNQSSASSARGSVSYVSSSSRLGVGAGAGSEGTKLFDLKIAVEKRIFSALHNKFYETYKDVIDKTTLDKIWNSIQLKVLEFISSCFIQMSEFILYQETYPENYVVNFSFLDDNIPQENESCTTFMEVDISKEFRKIYDDFVNALK
jgi:hypothetical protein